MRTCSWLGILALLGAANHAAAADGDTYARVCVTNAQGIRVMLDPAGASQPFELAARDATYKARISGRETMQIEFCEKNPVLFTYSVGELKTTPLEDVAALNALAGAIGEFAKLAGGIVSVKQKVASTDPTTKKTVTNDVDVPCQKPVVTSVNGIDLAKLRDDIDPFQTAYNGIATTIEVTHDPANSLLPEEKRKLAVVVAKAPAFRALIKALDDYATARITGRQIPYEIRETGGPVTGFIRGMDLAGINKCRTAALQPALSNLDFIANRSDKLAAMLDVLEALATALQGVGQRATAATMYYDSKNRREQPLTIGANQQFAKFFSPATKQFVADARKVGAITLQVEPQLDLRIEVAPGVIYSFVKQPKFSAEENDAGGFTITQTESNYSAASGIVAVNITRDKYSDENVRPFVQVGLWPKKDELAFVLGAGIALADASRAVLSFGAIYQERKKLAPGLAVGGALASADDLKTDTEFKVGFYVGVSYNMLPTK